MKKSNITYKTGFFRNLTTNRYTIYDTSELTKEHYQKLSSITKDNIPEERLPVCEEEEIYEGKRQW